MGHKTFHNENVVFLCIGNGEMNTPRDQCKYTTFSYGVINCMATLAIRILIANSCTRWRFILKKFSQYEGRTEIFEQILRLNLITAFSQVHLVGQYL
jgi:hypothetical protein